MSDTAKPALIKQISEERIIQNFRAVDQMAKRLNAENSSLRERLQEIELKLMQVQQQMTIMDQKLILVLTGTVTRNGNNS